jgi:hypothetical protein
MPLHADSPITALWRDAGQPLDALDALELPAHGPGLPSSFAVGPALQSSIAAAALAAAELEHVRFGRARRRVRVDRDDACAEASAWFALDGWVPDPWDPLSGLYRCGPDAEPGWVRIHANFAHHRDGALRLLGLPSGPDTPRAAVEQALRGWTAEAFEQAAADAGLVVAALRSFDDWDHHPAGMALAGQPTVSIERIGDAPPGATVSDGHSPAFGDTPLRGLRVLDLTRILAGPVAGRTLAAYGADVMLVNAPTLPNIDAIADTSRGKRSVHIDLATDAGRDALRTLVGDAQVFQQGYRPGALEARGFGVDALAAMRPGIVCVSLSAYGHTGPWATRRGFDSLVQTATGFNDAEARAAGSTTPKALPVQVLDYSAGFLMAFGALVAMRRQLIEGGSWHVRVSLAGVGRWLRGLGRVAGGLDAPRPALEPRVETTDSGFGRLAAIRHAACFDGTRADWRRPSMPPGSHPPTWADET